MTVVASGVGFMGSGLGLETEEETRSVCVWLHERASATIDAPGLRRPGGGDCRWWPWLRCRVGSGSNRRKGKMTRRRSECAMWPLPAVVARPQSSASTRLRRCVGSSMTWVPFACDFCCTFVGSGFLTSAGANAIEAQQKWGST